MVDVLVVDVMLRPFACLHEPDDPVRKVLKSIDD